MENLKQEEDKKLKWHSHNVQIQFLLVFEAVAQEHTTQVYTTELVIMTLLSVHPYK